MKSFFLFLTLLSLSLASFPRLLQVIRLLSSECNYHGYMYKNQCYCKPEWQGDKCDLTRTPGYADDTTTCDNLVSRLDFLTNISPENYPGDDYEFSRFSDKTIGEGEAAYGQKATTWIKMHDITTSWQIFGGVFQATDVHQGALGNCYLLAALASLAVHRNGQYIKDIFITQTDNYKHVYVTRWMVAGKPRFVAVDDYVPGSGKTPSFSQVTADFDYWAMIIEKSWAKIHGNYMATEAGIQTNIWKSLTQAPIFRKEIDPYRDTPAAIFNLIKDKFSKLYPIGTTTPKGIKTELEGHAYSIVGVYDLTLSSGAKLQLIKMYNPWNEEVWTGNPWSDASSKWTAEIKSLVGYVNKNDGIFFLTPQDFIDIFNSMNWAEVNPAYEISFVDIPIDNVNLNLQKDYTTNFKVSGNSGKQPIFVYVDDPDKRLFQDCGNPYELFSMKATTSSGAKIIPTQLLEYFIPVTNDDTYTFSASIVNKARYSKYLTVTAYHPKGVFTFTSKYPKATEKGCAALFNCNGNGKCNYLNGTCQCFKGFGGADCANKVVLS